MPVAPLRKLAETLRRTGQASGYGTYEQVPGRGIGHLEELIDAPFGERMRFTMDPRSSWDVDGQDALYRAMGYQPRQTQSMIGAFKPSAGGLEINPGRVAGLNIPATEAERAKTIRDMQAAESARAYIDAQNAGAGHMVFPLADTPSSDRTSFVADMSRSPTRDEMSGLVELANQYDFFPVDTGYGVSFINNPYEPQGAVRTGQSMADLARTLPDTGAFPPGVEITPARIDSVFEDYEKLFARPGSGAATRKFLDDVLGNPDVAQAIEPDLVRKAEANLLRDIEKQRTSGYAVRDDIQLARRILASEGIAGLKKALEAGAVLPAAAAAILMPDREE
jgi:hypothetical protein